MRIAVSVLAAAAYREVNPPIVALERRQGIAKYGYITPLSGRFFQ
jgi:hypothetical protein